MDQDHIEVLIKKAENNELTSTEKIELMRELNARLEKYNMLLKKALVEVPE